MSDDPTRTDLAPGDTAPPEAEGAGPTLCADCSGSGERDGEQCPTCLGSGTVIEGVGGA